MGISSRASGAVQGAPAVELRELQVFLTVAEELHFGRAAERLHINRSRVSQIIKTLESRVGAQLFERTSRRVRLTPIGEQVLTEVGGPYRELLDALARARQVARGVAGTLRIGMYLPINGGRYMVKIIRAFTARHPEAGVEFIDTGFQRDDLEWLRAGDVDMLATRLPATDPDVTLGPVLSREQRVLVVSKDDPLAARASVCRDDFADRLVADTPPFRRELIDVFIPPVAPSGRRLRRVTTRSPEDLLLRIAIGEQVHPTVASMLAYFSHPEITSVPISDLPPSETALAWLTTNRSVNVHAFARTAADVLACTELAPCQPVRAAASRVTADTFHNVTSCVKA
ncbi:MAG TPA: LysR family transcriptional regulator [Solirubrobacteraceae bacterium]|nr:LysR family transcriptional regulator [Solirubrobacteraceae bacterium]